MRIGITLGDPGGIGPEIVLKALKVLRKDYLLIGSKVVLKYFAEKLDLPIPKAELVDVGGTDFTIGEDSSNNGEIAYRSLIKGIEVAKEGIVNAIVTAPLSKKGMAMAGHIYPGQTEILAETTGSKNYGMMMVSKKLKILFVTAHIPLKDVSCVITTELLRQKIDLCIRSMKKLFKIDSPSIGVLGLNPHAGEGGYIGREEIEVIKPVIEALKRSGNNIDGPFPSDTYFSTKSDDCVIAMYHDQGMIPFKIFAFDEGVNLTVGLPFIRTSPDHGTAFDIVGRGIARPDSIISAIRLAEELCVL